MPYAYDPEYLAAAKDLIEMSKSAPPVPVHDINGRRERMKMLVSLLAAQPRDPLVQTTPFSTPSKDGSEVPLFWYDTAARKAAPAPTAAVLHVHGGGMIAGSVSEMEAGVVRNVSTSGVPFLSVDYRLAPEAKGTKMIEDAYAGLTWLRDHAAELNVDPRRIMVMGESAGGGIAAGLALYARDQGFAPPLAKQVLVYPMLDDRNTVEDPELAEFAVWKTGDNVTGWTALLGEGVVGTDKASIYNVPARAKDFSGLPPAYIDVGSLDIFAGEDLEYAKQLLMAQNAVEFHLYPGLPHGFEIFGGDISSVKLAYANRVKALRSV